MLFYEMRARAKCISAEHRSKYFSASCLLPPGAARSRRRRRNRQRPPIVEARRWRGARGASWPVLRLSKSTFMGGGRNISAAGHAAPAMPVCRASSRQALSSCSPGRLPPHRECTPRLWRRAHQQPCRGAAGAAACREQARDESAAAACKMNGVPCPRPSGKWRALSSMAT